MMHEISKCRVLVRSLRAAEFVCLAALAPAHAQDSTDPIKLTLHDWIGQLITTRIMGKVLKEAGNSVDYVQADDLAQFVGLESGDLHIAMEIWQTTGREAMDAAIATGKVESFGPTGMQAKEEWWYPLYMKAQCPGLPNWKAPTSARLRSCCGSMRHIGPRQIRRGMG